MIPPFRTPGKASWCGSGCQSATTSSPSGKLRMRRPRAFAGPQPKHVVSGAYRSCRLVALTEGNANRWRRASPIASPGPDWIDVDPKRYFDRPAEHLVRLYRRFRERYAPAS